jgi:hypothetical protein
MVIRPPTTPTWPHLLSHQNPLAAATTGDNSELTEPGQRVPRVLLMCVFSSLLCLLPLSAAHVDRNAGDDPPSSRP